MFRFLSGALQLLLPLGMMRDCWNDQSTFLVMLCTEEPQEKGSQHIVVGFTEISAK